MAQFAATQGAIDKGLENLKSDQACGVIDGWIKALHDSGKVGVDGVAGDLASLKTELEHSTPNAGKVSGLIHKLGVGTTKLAGAAEGANADKLRKLGEALTSAGA